jgi:pre-60S factor REI1
METEENSSDEQKVQEEGDVDAMQVTIDPRQCLFDRHVSATVAACVDRMYRKYGFFVPDREHVQDLTGLVGYCHEKVLLGHMCLYCHRVFTTSSGCQKHMISSNHTKLRYEAGWDLEDLAVFYDFEETNADFMQRLHRKDEVGSDMTVEEAEPNDEDGWEDISDDEAEMEEEDPDEDDESLYEGYEDEVARMGFDVTPLGELVFPDGRIVGHRSLMRYYRQRPRPQRDSTAVVAARSAAGERLYRGKVYNVNPEESSKALTLAKAGISPSLAAGRAGKGILVASGNGTWSQLSVYRYRAAIRKQRRGERQGKRLYEKTQQNMNRMDKKANRLMNDVSVARAPR